MNLQEKLLVSWKRIKKDRRTDFIVDDFEYKVFDRFKNELIVNLAEELDLVIEGEKEYQPQKLRCIRVPKNLFTTRPGTLPTIQDRIYYQLLVDEIAEDIEDKLIPIDDGIVHSYRYCGDRTSSDMFRYNSASWKTFEEKTMELTMKHDYVVITDISAFFEKIYHHDLENTLRGLGANHNYVDLLMNLLRKWEKGKSYSIPQGIWPSDYLGNIYLDKIDKFMVRRGYDYFRYNDDIRIGVDSQLSGQQILLQLEKQIAAIGLTLNAAKTKIIPAIRVESELFPHTTRIEEIKKELSWYKKIEDHSFNPYDADLLYSDDLENENEDPTPIRELYKEQKEENFPEPAIVRFCLKNLKRLRDDSILFDVLDNLDKLIVVTSTVVNYLSFIYDHVNDLMKENISKTVANFIEDKLTVHDWQVMWFLQFLSRLKKLGEKEVTSIRNLSINKKGDVHDAVLVNALLLLGKHGDSTDRELIKDLYEKNNSIWVKQALLFSLHGLSKTNRNHFYSYCIGQNLFTDKVIEFVKERYS